jgi:hypothetical protein
MKVFELTDVYKDTFDVFDTDGSAGTLSISDSTDGIFVYDVETPETKLELVSSDVAASSDLCQYTLNYGQSSGYAGKVYIEIDMSAELNAEAFFKAGHLYKVVVFGTVGSIAIEGAEVREFAVAPYGSCNVTAVNGTAVEEDEDPVGDITAIRAVVENTTYGNAAIQTIAAATLADTAAIEKLLKANQVIDLDAGTLQYIDADDGVTVLLTKHCYTETNGSLLKISAKTDIITQTLASEV